MKKQAYMLLLAAISLLASSYCSSSRQGQPPRVDTVTGASIKASGTLPSAGDTYRVIGWVDGLKSFVIEYDKSFFRGGDILSERGSETLKRFGIRTIVSISPTDLERAMAIKYGMHLVEMPFKNEDPLPRAVMKKYLTVLRSGKGPYYVHCHGGTHRAGALGVAYRVHIQGWPFRKAYDEFIALGGDRVKDKNLIESLKRI